jgi:flagellar basal-body rod protein FlgB
MSMIDDPMVEALGRFLDVDVSRHKLITANLANIDTPGYRTRDLDFHAELARASVEAVRDQWASYAGYGESYAGVGMPNGSTPVVKRVRGLLERPDGNNVNVERESLLLAENQLKFNLGIQLIRDQFHGISQAINSGGTSS